MILASVNSSGAIGWRKRRGGTSKVSGLLGETDIMDILLMAFRENIVSKVTPVDYNDV